MITYKGFIAKLQRLAEEASRIRTHKRMHMDPAFRTWRTELESLVRQIKEASYQFSFPFNSEFRSYGRRIRPLDDEDVLFQRYQREIDDTLIEIQNIIKSYEDFGEPIQIARAAATGLQHPDRVTLAWLWHHVPWSAWLSAVGVLAAVFGAGVFVGRTNLIMQVWALLSGR